MTNCTCGHHPSKHRGRWPQVGWVCTACTLCTWGWPQHNAYDQSIQKVPRHEFAPCPCTTKNTEGEFHGLPA